jgi:diguanylate cyclase
MLFISSQIITNRRKPLNFNIKSKILLGVVGGIVTIILIEFSIYITPKVVMDFRQVPQMLIAIFGGFVPVIITGLIAAIFRIIYLDVTNISIIASMGILTVSFGLGIISKLKINFKTKWIIMSTYSLILYSIVLGIVYDKSKGLLNILMVYWLISILIAIAIYFFIQYFIKVYNLFKTLKKQSTKDFLTGLNNTRQFDLDYNNIQNSIDKEEKVALLIIDIDHYKNVNDTYGHVAGDEVLKQLSLLLLKSCRENDFVARIGGEEFSVIIRNLSIQEVLVISERIRKSVEKHLFALANEKNLQMTVSIGVGMYPDTVENIENLKEFADLKLYEAKRTGRNKVCF